MWLLADVVLCLSAKRKVHFHLPWEIFFQDSGLVVLCCFLFLFLLELILRGHS